MVDRPNQRSAPQARSPKRVEEGEEPPEDNERRERTSQEEDNTVSREKVVEKVTDLEKKQKELEKQDDVFSQTEADLQSKINRYKKALENNPREVVASVRDEETGEAVKVPLQDDLDQFQEKVENQTGYSASDVDVEKTGSGVTFSVDDSAVQSRNEIQSFQDQTGSETSNERNTDNSDVSATATQSTERSNSLQAQSDFFKDTNPEYVQEYYGELKDQGLFQSYNQVQEQKMDDPLGKTLTAEQLQETSLSDLRRKANLDSSETAVLQLQASSELIQDQADDKLGPVLEDVQKASPVDVPMFDLKEFGTGLVTEPADIVLSGGAIGAQTGKVLAPLNPTEGKIYVQGDDGTMELKTENLKAPDVGESFQRLSATDDLTVKGGSMFVESVKQNPEKQLSGEVYPEIAGAVVGGASVTSSTTTETASNVNVDIRESSLPDLETAQGETLQQARMKEGAGVRNTGQETAQGRSVTKTDGSKSQTESEQPALYGKAEYEVDGDTVTEEFIGNVQTSTETKVTDSDGSANPMEETEFDYQTEGTAKVEMEKIAENGEFGVQDGTDQVLIDEIEAEGSGKTNPVMVQADPEGNVKVGYTKETGETGSTGESSFASITESTGVKDIDSGVGKSISETVTRSGDSTSKTSSKNIQIDTEKLPDADNVRNRNQGSTSSDSSESSDFQEIDASDSSMIDEMMGEFDSGSSTESTSSSSQTDSTPTKDFDRTDYDGSGTGTIEIQKTPDQSSSSDVGPDSSTTSSESFREALETKIQNKEFQSTNTEVDVGVKGSVAQNDLQGEVEDLDVGEGIAMGQGQVQDQGQDNPPVEDEITVNDVTLDFGGTGGSGESSYSFASTSSGTSSTGKFDVDLGSEDAESQEMESDLLTGEKGREYTASLDAQILGITGDKKEYDLGTRPIVEENGEKESININTKDDDLI